MARFIDRDLPPATSVNVDSESPRSFDSTGSGARKFRLPEIGLVEDETFSTLNDDHLIDGAVGLKSLSLAADAIASQARAALDTVRLSLAAVDPLKERTSQISADTQSVDAAALASQKVLSEILSQAGAANPGTLAKNLQSDVQDTAFVRNTEKIVPSFVNRRVPSLDRLTISMNKAKGKVDCFVCDVEFSLPTSQLDVRAFRIFRAQLPGIRPARNFVPTLSRRGMDLIASNRNLTRPGGETMSALQTSLEDAEVPNSLTILNPIDPTTNLRISTNNVDSFSSGSLNSFSVGSKMTSNNTLSSEENQRNFDRSVGEDLNTARNIERRSPSVVSLPDVLTIDTSRKNLPSVSRNIVEQNNSSEFKEIGFLSPDLLKSETIGDRAYFTFSDETVLYGRGYRYFVCSVDANMIDSLRTQMVDVFVEGVRVPARPSDIFWKNVDNSIVMNISVGDSLVEKFEVFRKDLGRVPRSTPVISRVISDLSGFNTNTALAYPSSNGFVKISEVAKDSGASIFRDSNVVSGRAYEYRVYSVDVFGNKSESPFVVTAFVPDRSSKNNDLIKPTITAEIDAETLKTRLTIRCVDSRVIALQLTRKDLTIGQRAFSSPGGVGETRLGIAQPSQGSFRFEGPTLRGENKEVSWNGNFENIGEIVFIDKTATFDHTYQYRVCGVDRFGNQTPFEYTRPVMVIRRPMINAPANLSVQVVQGPNFTVAGHKLSWQEGNVDVSAEDRLGNRSDLSDSSVRTLYQIERKREGEERWLEFPLVEGPSFFDPSRSMMGRETLAFMPVPIEENASYSYRMRALQTGSFFSNYTSEVRIFSSLPVREPANVRIKTAPPRVFPTYVTVNWETRRDSGAIDSWQIDRYVANNFFSDEISSGDQRILDFPYSPYRTVFKESSRSTSNLIDLGDQNASVTGSGIFSGEHYFQDLDVSSGNTYFYRIRSLGIDGSPSAWTYRAIRLADERTERIFSSLIDEQTRRDLLDSGTPIRLTDSYVSLNSFSLEPEFSRPDLSGDPKREMVRSVPERSGLSALDIRNRYLRS